MLGRSALWLTLWLATLGRASEPEAALFAAPSPRTPSGISIALSEETADAPVSLFGHLFAVVRTRDAKGEPWPLRLEEAVNVAVAADGPLDRAAFRLAPLHRLLHEANVKEQRSVVIVDLVLTPQEIDALMDALRQKTAGDVPYDLLRRNCAYYTLDWLSTVRPGIIDKVRLRPVWTPRQAMQLIEAAFSVSRRVRIPAQPWESEANAGKSAHEGEVDLSGQDDWAATEEGFGARVISASVEGSQMLGIGIQLGQRDHATRPVGADGSNKLVMLGITHLAGDGQTRSEVELLQLESLREWSSEKPRLSQRLELTWSELPRVDGLTGWIAQVETGLSRQASPGLWLSAMGGISACEGSRGPVRPVATLQLLRIAENGCFRLAYRDTGGDESGWRAGGTLRIAASTELHLTWVSPGNAPTSSLEASISKRF